MYLVHTFQHRIFVNTHYYCHDFTIEDLVLEFFALKKILFIGKLRFLSTKQFQ